MKKVIRELFTIVVGVLGVSIGIAQDAHVAKHWVGSWATSVQIPESQNSLTSDDLTNATVRQIVHLSIGGDVLRVHLSNAFGTSALHLIAVHIARPLSPASSTVDLSTDVPLTFFGSSDVLIPPGAQYISDPVDFKAKPLSDIAISFYLELPPVQQTGHPGSRATTYISHGNLVSQTELSGAKTVDHWYTISGIDVVAPRKSFSIAVLGDSITDGHAATTNGNDRWTDVLAARLQATSATHFIGVLNHGIGGNHLLTDGLGPNALARFDRDILAQTSVRYLIVLEGINDLGSLARMRSSTADQHATLVRRIIASYQQIIERSHQLGLKVIGATILPDGGSDYYHPSDIDDADRREVNQWILGAGHFDVAIDLDKLMADPRNPTHLLPGYDSGDHLHPSPAGYSVMGKAFPASLFTK
jgi:lysophospholipase L1-like esterase